MNDAGRIRATAHDLAAFHTERAGIYRVMAGMIGVPPTPRAMEALRVVLDEAKRTESPALHELARAIEWEDVGRMLEDYFNLVDGVIGLPDLRCIDPDSATRTEAFRALGRVENGSALSELLVMSQLAERGARAMRQGDWASAEALTELQQRFLDDHAAHCLARLAAALLSSGFPLYKHAAHVLARRVHEDLTLLDGRRPRRLSASS
jgi:hypothetical protein